MDGQQIFIAVFCVVAGATMSFVAVRFLDRLRRKDAETEALDIVERAKTEATNRVKEAELEIKEKALAERSAAERELSKQREQLMQRERTLDKRQELLEQQGEDVRKQERMVETTQRRLAERLDETAKTKDELNHLVDQQRRLLHEVSGMSESEATTRLLELTERDLTQEAGNLILKHRRKLEATCQQEAREMLLTTLQRYAAAHTAESTTSTIDIPNDDMKGRIIGREGRNIRAFEKETGVDVIIDDTPGVVIVSGFDPVRREVARISLNKLIADGRIHPTRIEEVVGETQSEVDNYLKERGEEATLEVDVAGLHPRIVQMLGRLHFRTSYSQNVLRHSVEVAFLTGMMAELIGLDGPLARRCGLLHDIGKAADHEMEGGHPKIGADLLKRHKEPPEVVHAALGHHDDLVTDKPYTMLVATADACSASRPGARRETLERYIKRMEELEEIAREFDGVDQAFAIQAGRELRVIANAQETTDAQAANISRSIAKAFESQLTYPGEIKVTVVRESRFSEIAK